VAAVEIAAAEAVAAAGIVIRSSSRRSRSEYFRLVSWLSDGMEPGANAPCNLIDGAKLRMYTGKYAPVAQLDRAAASGAVGREFESLRAHHLLPFVPSR
jgi:hypothetical protein